MTQRILVTGGSVAANTLAWWLVKGGFTVTVIEKAPEFREGGQNVDVRGAAGMVLERMGLKDKVSQNGTGETGWTFVDERGEAVATFQMADIGANGPTAELEILRGKLARILYEQVREEVDYRFGDSVEAIDDNGACARVRLRSGAYEEYDLVLVAEGVGSSTRELVFKGENDPRWMDVTMGYFTIPKGHGDGDEARWYNAPGGRSVFLRPDNVGTTRAVLTLQHNARHAPERSTEEHKAWLKATFADAGWESPRVLVGLDQADDLYVDVLRQVKMPRWSKGRVALTGDAAWCATPLSGIGTTLSIVGAYVLAGELAKECNHPMAFRSYEEVMRPLVEKGQGGGGNRIGARLNHPRSKIGISIQRKILGIASKPVMRGMMAKFSMPPAEGIALPNYEFDESR